VLHFVKHQCIISRKACSIAEPRRASGHCWQDQCNAGYGPFLRFVNSRRAYLNLKKSHAAYTGQENRLSMPYQRL
jgi:hypothetical protein